MQWLKAPVAAIAGFLIASSLAAHLLPTPDLPHTVREKVAHLSEHGDEYDAIFLGSSRIQNHLIPNLFDRQMAAGGVSMKSFNFGISAMHFPEDDYVLDFILAQPHARLRWIFVELDFFDTSVPKDQAGTLRGVYWHDWPRFSIVCHRLAVSKEKGIRRSIRDAFERTSDFIDHARLFCELTSNAGRGEDALAHWMDRVPPKPLDPSSLGPDGDGWLPAISSQGDIANQKSGRLAKMLKERIMEPPAKQFDDRTSQNILASYLERIVRSGVTPIIVIPPRIRQYYFYPRKDIARQFPIIDFCDPQRFPELYKESVRVDGSHLNEAGAEIFTRLLANEFSAILHKAKF